MMRHPSPPRAFVRGRVAPLALVLSTVALLASPAEAQSVSPKYKVIVNASNPVKSLSRVQLAGMFLKKIDAWETGALVTPIDQPERAPVRQSFSRDVIGKPPAAVKSYWNQLIFSGRSIPPVERLSDTDVINFVKVTPSAVGYVLATTPTKGVKVVVLVGS
jgi:ABC-type phosphate transport system substrate-binding protein